MVQLNSIKKNWKHNFSGKYVNLTILQQNEPKYVDKLDPFVAKRVQFLEGLGYKNIQRCLTDI